MKIAIVTSYAPSSISFRGELIAALISKGHRVEVLAPDHTFDTRKKLTRLGASAIDYPLSRGSLSPLRDLFCLVKLFTLFCRIQPDVVLTYFVKPNIWGILAASFARVPWRVALIEGMGYAFTQGSNGRRTFKQIIVSWLIQLLYRLAFMQASRVVVLNRDDMRDLQIMCGLKASKAVLLGGIGVCLSKWQMQLPCTQPLTFTMVARLLREKGVFEFLDSARLLKNEFPFVRFLLLGGFDDSPGAIGIENLRAYAATGLVNIMGHVDVMPWLLESSVFVLPSYYREGVPRSTQEAMALGLPVVTTDVPGCRETVVDNVNGFLVAPRDSSALADAMKRFILHPELIAKMGRESRRLAEERFDVHKSNAKLIEVLKA